MPDTEIEAMSKIVDALDRLGEDERGRVLRWAAERYRPAVVSVPQGAATGDINRWGTSGMSEGVEIGEVPATRGENESESEAFEHFAELYDKIDPKSDAEKALVASYWTQFIKGKADFGSRELNGELKELGHAVSAINKAMISNMSKKPALILQVSRGGSSQQSRKKYKLSAAGKNWIEDRLR